jgi:hypothetical protein
MAATARYAGPAELTVRVSGADKPVVQRLYGLLPGSVRAPYRPDRLVVDAHVPLTAAGADLGKVAREAGVAFLIDPETYYLQDSQHAEAPWCATPYAHPGVTAPVDLLNPLTQQTLVKLVVDYQLAHGATTVIAPYVHVERPGPGWVQVQAGLWGRTGAYLTEAGINLPVVAVVAIGWRCLHPLQGVRALRDMWDALAVLDPDEIALAASKVDAGADPAGRIAELLMLVTAMCDTYPKVTMWQQGLLGEACVIQGAAGYECGIGWRERCDLQTRKAQYRAPSNGHPGPRPVYVHEIGRGISKRRLELARTKRRLWSRLVCPHPDCCAPGGDDLLADARRHTVVARARELASLYTTPATRWRWNRLTQRLAEGVEMAGLLNGLGPSSTAIPGVDIRSLNGLYEIANARRTRPSSIRRTA